MEARTLTLNIVSVKLLTLDQMLIGDLGKYLGMPLIHFQDSKHTYYEIIEKVERCLYGWATSHLSLVGRITLAQSVLQVIHIYAM